MGLFCPHIFRLLLMYDVFSTISQNKLKKSHGKDFLEILWEL